MQANELQNPALVRRLSPPTPAPTTEPFDVLGLGALAYHEGIFYNGGNGIVYRYDHNGNALTNFTQSTFGNITGIAVYKEKLLTVARGSAIRVYNLETGAPEPSFDNPNTFEIQGLGTQGDFLYLLFDNQITKFKRDFDTLTNSEVSIIRPIGFTAKEVRAITASPTRIYAAGPVGLRVWNNDTLARVAAEDRETTEEEIPDRNITGMTYYPGRLYFFREDE